MFCTSRVIMWVLAIPSFLIASELPDFEEGRQGFVMETHRIQLPGHPHAFNPSLIEWKGRLLMSFREIILPKIALSPWPYEHEAESVLGLVWLSDNFEILGDAQLLDIKGPATHPSRSEDARLIVVNDRLLMVYSNNCDDTFSDGGFRMYVAEVKELDGIFYLDAIDCIRHFDGENPQRREKNWVPFSYQQELFFSYSLNPHRVLHYLEGTGACETIACTGGRIKWPWGDLRGGTPAFPIDEDHYLGFFHSCKDMKSVHSNGKTSLHYFIGAYLQNRYPPFRITQVSDEPIVGIGFYHGIQYKPYWKPVQVVFPGGFVLRGEEIWLAYGRQDHEIWIVKIDRRSLLESLVDVKENKEGKLRKQLPQGQNH